MPSPCDDVRLPGRPEAISAQSNRNETCAAWLITRRAPSPLTLWRKCYQTDKKATRTELIIFIRPQIIRDSMDAHFVAEELRSKLRGSINASVANESRPLSLNSDRQGCGPTCSAGDGRMRIEPWKSSSVGRTISAALFFLCSVSVNGVRVAHADGLGRATAAYSSGDYTRAVNG
jgi:hypothetical protein